MEEFTLENVLKAIHCMYSSTQPQNIEEIDKWLKSYQKSQAPWGLVGVIFGTQGLPDYAYIFNAQTLKTKLMFDFEEIKSLDMGLFRANLLNLCLQYATQERVMRQLAQSIGIMSIHLADTWSSTMLSDLSSMFSSCYPVLFEVLKCIAEEINNQSIVVDSDKVIYLRTTLEKQARDIIKFLESLSSTYPNQVLQVFLAWVQFGIDEEIASLLPTSRLLQISCEAIKVPANFDTGCGVLCELINLTENYQTYEATVKTLVQFLISIKPLALKSVNELGVVEGYIKLYTSLGFTHMERILMEKAEPILEILVDLCATKSSDGIYELTQFWRGTCKMYKRLLTEEKNFLTEFFEGLLNRLLPICIGHFQLDQDELKNGIDKETDGVRYNVSIILSYISDILSCTKVLGMLKGHLIGVLSNSALGNYEKFSQIEAIAGCTASIAELCDKKDLTEDLTQIISHLCSQIWPVSQINVTISSIFENCTKELEPNILKPVLEYLVACLNSQPSAKNVALALRKTLLVNSKALYSHIDYLLTIQPLCETLPEKSHEAVLEGISTVIWRSPQNREIFSLCRTYAQRLLDHPAESVLLYNCDKIAILFKVTVTDKEIEAVHVYNLFKEIWPVIQKLVHEYQSSDSAVEDICRIVKHAMKKLNHIFGEFLEDFLKIIVSQFTQYKQSSYLYMAEQLVKIFGEVNLYQSIMLEVFTNLVTSSLSVLNSVEALSNNPDLTEDFFGMVNRNINHLSHFVVDSSVFENVMLLAKAGIGLQHAEAAKCLYTFLEITLEYCHKEGRYYSGNPNRTLAHHYQDILISLFKILVTAVPGKIYEFIEDLMYKVLLIDDGPVWLVAALREVPHDCLTEGEKEKFVKECQNARNIHNWLKKVHKRAKQRAQRFR